MEMDSSAQHQTCKAQTDSNFMA